MTSAVHPDYSRKVTPQLYNYSNMKTMAFELTQAYLELTGNALVRNLLSACIFDDKTRSFDVKESVVAITAKCAVVTGGPTKEELRTARVQIMSFLSRLYYTCLGADASTKIPIEWWWEMSFRLQKLRIVSATLERNNLIGMGERPTTTDVPQPITWLGSRLDKEAPVFAELREKYMTQVTTDPVLCSVYEFE